MQKCASYLLVFCLFVLNACQQNDSNHRHSAAFDIKGMDTTVQPGDDFFQYANGTWLNNEKIPDDQNGWGSFYILYQENLKKLRTILQDLSTKSAIKGSIEQKAGDFYTSGMDTTAIEQAGNEPLKPMFQKIEAVTNYKGLVNLLTENIKDGNSSLLDLSVSADEKNSSRNIVILTQTGLTLPEKDYYFKTDSTTISQRKKLTAYIARLFVLTGTDSNIAFRKATEIVKLETKIAKAHRSPVALRDPILNYNKMSVAALQKISPNIGWEETLPAMNIHTDSINLSQPDYYEALSKLLASESIEVWKDKIKFDYIADNAEYLSKNFRDTKFEYTKIFSGQKVQQERWKTIVGLADHALKDVVGELYVKKYFPPDAKKRMDELVNNLQKAFSVRINKLDWMSDTTKKKAQEKLTTILKKIGYPDKWKSYADVEISKDNFFGNLQNIGRHDYKEMIAKIGQPVDRTEWGMTPPTVNAYYNPTQNEIVFPAGILQPPFFNPEADDAINYGGIGMVIGHEITHGFDDQGRLYDAKGNLNEWWTAQDAEKFKEKAKKVVAQYNQYTMLDTLHINGELTLGENLADIGGVAIAYDAFNMTQQAQGNELIDGFTPDQRFFLGLAQIWRIVLRPQAVRLRISVDPHSPARYRINGPLSDFDPFYKAFNVTEKNKLYRHSQDRVVIW